MREPFIKSGLPRGPDGIRENRLQELRLKTNNYAENANIIAENAINYAIMHN